LFEDDDAGFGTPVGQRLTLFETDGRRAVYLGHAPIYVYEVGDQAAESACIAMLSRADLASDVSIGEAFGCHRNTVGRLARRLAVDGMAAVVPAKRGPKGPHKVTPEVLEVIEAESPRMSASALVEVIAERTGVRLSVSHVRRLAAIHRPVQPELPELAGEAEVAAVAAGQLDGGGVDDQADARPEGDIDAASGGVDESGADNDPGAAVAGFDPPAIPPRRASGRYMGLALYFPAIAALGLVEAARGCFRLPRSTRFGVRAVILSLLFMTLLKKPTVESAKHLRRAEFGALIGTDRAPCVKTLRRKLDTLVAQNQATEFGVRLARGWVEAGIVATGYLYVDGHVKVYSGKRQVAEVYHSQRRLALPGVHSYFVGDQDGRPLLMLTEPLSPNLANAMPEIIAAIRRVVGARRFTVVFDRGGFDGKLFTWLTEQRIGFITYQRGDPKLPDHAFVRRETRFEGRPVKMRVAEDGAWVNGRGPWRRIVVRGKDGHQVPILTNLGAGTGSARIACLLFARWRQENLFKYLKAHHGLDQLVSYGAEPADGETVIFNPERRRLERQLAELRRQAAKLKAALGDAVLDKRDWRSARGLKIAHGKAQRGAVGHLRALERDIKQLAAARNALPKHVTVADSGTDRDVLRGEHKAIVDRIKITAYNAEEWLLDHLVRHYPNRNDVRDLLRSFAELSGQIRTTRQGVTVTLDPPDTPLHRQALQGLVADLNMIKPTYPGTDLPVTYRVRMHHSETAA
jgi:hypothetical protein